MEGRFDYRVWLPLVVTGTGWLGLIFAIDATVSRTWADLFGLLSLVAMPFIYGRLKSFFNREIDVTEAELHDPDRKSSASSTPASVDR